jgi:sulfite reductase beta subunit-like hemoprotein
MGEIVVTTDARPETEVEGIKRTSDSLRGDIALELDNALPRVSNESEQLLKFHGIYAQDNRDVRRERTLAKESLDYIFMIRVVIPGGKMTTDQWLALDQVSSNVADGTIRLTTRQAVQFHGVVKEGLRPLARALDQELMASFGACGDVVRNVVSCPSLETTHGDPRLSGIAARPPLGGDRPTTLACLSPGDRGALGDFRQRREGGLARDRRRTPLLR